MINFVQIKIQQKKWHSIQVFSSTQTEGAIAKVIQAIALPDSILSITSETSSSELNAALGGADGFNDLIEKIQSGAINQGIITTSDGHLASIPVSIHTDVAKTKINIFVQYMEWRGI